MRHLFTAMLLSLASGWASAHAGHGFTGPHWHAEELVLPLLLVGAVVAAWWLRRKP